MKEHEMGSLYITIDGERLSANPGETVLEVALRNSLFIPHLCYMDGEENPFAGCRLCFVEMEDSGKLVASCTCRVQDGMRLRTDTERVRSLQRLGFRLLMSNHRVDCNRCVANGRCKLQELAKFLKVGLKERRLRDLSLEPSADLTLKGVVYDQSKCILCGRCVRWAKRNGTGVFQFAGRGLKTKVAVFPWQGDPALIDGCWKICPVGALYPANGA